MIGMNTDANDGIGWPSSVSSHATTTKSTAQYLSIERIFDEKENKCKQAGAELCQAQFKLG